MKITESQLRAIIKQELKNAINEAVPTDDEMWGPYVPKPRVPLTPEQKAERAAKAAATRLRNKEETAARYIEIDAREAAIKKAKQDRKDAGLAPIDLYGEDEIYNQGMTPNPLFYDVRTYDPGSGLPHYRLKSQYMNVPNLTPIFIKKGSRIG